MNTMVVEFQHYFTLNDVLYTPSIMGKLILIFENCKNKFQLRLNGIKEICVQQNGFIPYTIRWAEYEQT